MKLWGIPFIVSVLFLTGCKPKQEHINGQTMGTYYSIRFIPTAHSPTLKALKTDIDLRLAQINEKMSTYRTNSEISRFNASQTVNVPFPVSSAVITVVTEAIRIHQITGGAFDVTVGPLVNLWGFGPGGQAKQIPSATELAQRRTWIGSNKLSVYHHHALIKKTPKLYVDLSAIAKGYAVDVIADYLQLHHINDYLVDIGGEVRTHGHNQRDKPWRIAIESPTTGIGQHPYRIIEPGKMAVATSGDYRNYFEHEGIRYSHTIDPASGKPITHHLVSITVLNPRCITADGLATGLNVLGPQRGMALANQLAIPVFMIIRTKNGFEERYSEAFKPYLHENH